MTEPTDGSHTLLTARYEDGDMDTIGVIADPDHPVFGGAGERLAARGFGVRFFSPGERIDPATVDDLAALAVGAVDPAAVAALHHADRGSVETFNGYLPTTALGNRLVALSALEAVGCRVPATWLEEPDDAATYRFRHRWPGLDRSAPGFYQEVAGTGGPTHRYYAVDDGVETHVTAIELRRELSDRDRIVEEADVDVERATRLRELLDGFGARAVTVDFVDGEDGWYAVDADPVPTFVYADMERHLADALASLTTIGA